MQNSSVTFKVHRSSNIDKSTFPLNPSTALSSSREREMQCVGRSTMIEGAKEELEILEFQHPNKFHSMKLELKAFISELESQDTPCPSAATQESSSRKKRKKTCSVVEASNVTVVGIKRRCKTAAVLERARQCLHKIQHLKTSFFY